MPNRRRCLVPGCDCRGYLMDPAGGQLVEEDLNAERGGLVSYCSLCGHSEEEHELAPAE